MNAYQARAKVFKALAHPVRLHILELLALGPSCVCDLVMRTGHRQANISQHLALLRAAGLVQTNREGLYVWYSLAQPAVEQFLETPIQQKAGQLIKTGSRSSDEQPK